MSSDWRFLRQAISDYRIYQQLLGSDGVPRCQQLHYLQMCTEKLAKGFLCRSEGDRPERSHNAFVRFMQAAGFVDEIRRVNHYNDRSAFRSYIRELLDKAREVEDLSPEGLEHANPEYPWEAGGVVNSPLDHDFPGLDPRRDVATKRLLDFLRNCFELTELRRL